MIGKFGKNIRITVSVFKYPELERNPGGATIDVANTTELFRKIPKLVKLIMKEIAPPKTGNRLPPIKWPKIKKHEVFDYYTVYNELALFGYEYSPGLPLGFSLGFFGVYTSMGFAVPNWEGKTWDDSTYNDSDPYIAQRYEVIDWVIGYNITLIPRMLYLPIGVGVEANREWRFPDSYHAEYWHPDSQYDTNVLFEAGLLFRPTNKIEFEPRLFGEYRSFTFSPYISGTYRNIGTNKHSFSIGVGVSFEKRWY